MPEENALVAARPRHIKRHLLSLLLSLLIILAYGEGLTLLSSWHKGRRAEVASVFIAEQRVVTANKAHQIEDMIRQMYQGCRTIALLPGIRRVAGGNRPKDSNERYDSTRLSEDSAMVVQQLYNNMAANVNVSEVYCVLEGFDPSREIPFFMFDELIVQSRDKGDKRETAAGSEAPEEVEDEEYAYYVTLLSQVRAEHPRFDYRSLDDIPCYLSSPLRTCDNSQYRSMKSGDPVNARGFIFSVPAYSNGGTLIGFISAIVRDNVFEAALLDVPFLIVTEEDQRQAVAQGWSMPPQPGRFLLRAPDRQILIHDRRNRTVVDELASSPELDGVSLAIRNRIDNPTRQNWQLEYLVDRAALDVRLADQQRMFNFGAMALTLSFLLALGLVLQREWQRRLIRKELKGIGDHETECVAQITTRVGHLSSMTRRVAENAEEQAASLEEASASLEEMASMAKQSSDHAQRSSQISRETRAAAEDGIAKMEELSRGIDAIRQSGEEISVIIKAIDEITFQTNMLSINAAIESAHAGDAGASFAVVANEMRQLARRCAAAARETAEKIEGAHARSVAGAELSSRVNESFKGIIRKIQVLDGLVTEAATAAREQSQSIEQLNVAASRLDQANRSNATSARESASASDQVKSLTLDLKNIVDDLIAMVEGRKTARNRRDPRLPATEDDGSFS